MLCLEYEMIVLPQRNNGVIRFAKLARTFHNCVEHRSNIGRRGCDDTQDAGAAGLMSERLRKFMTFRLHLVEQPRVLDGDDGLGGEVLNQLDLFVGERAHLLAEDVDDANQLIFMEHWDAENAAIAAKLDGSDGEWMALDISPLQRRIDGLAHLLCLRHTPKVCVGGW